MIKPIVNLNGETRVNLLEANREIREALLAAAQLMQENAPHPRDYPGEPDRCRADREESLRRIALVQELYELYYEEAIHLSNEG